MLPSLHAKQQAIISTIIPRPQQVTLLHTPPLILPQEGFFFDVDKSLLDTRETLLIPSHLDESKKTPALKVRLVPTPSPRGEEAYSLSISPQGIEVTCSSRKGLLHALASLNLLGIQNKTKEGAFLLPSIHIIDAPSFSHRGFMLDSSRHFQSVKTIERLLDMMALLKLNTFHWHLSDHEGWRAEVPGYEKLTQIGGFLNPHSYESQRNGFYSVADMQHLANYAKQRGIAIIPELDVPGHSSALIASYPSLGCPHFKVASPTEWISNSGPSHVPPAFQHLADKRPILCPAHPDIIPILTDIFVSVAHATQATCVHLGGDEVARGIWSSCPLCLAYMKKHGITNEHDLQKDFLSRLSASLQAKGLQTMIWSEEPQKGLPKVDVAIAWKILNYNEVKTITDQSISCIDASGKYAYYDYPEYPENSKPSWMPTMTLEQVYRYNAQQINPPANQPSLLRGGLCCLWTENIQEQSINAMLFPRILAFSEQMWSSQKGKNPSDFFKRLRALRPALSSMGITFSSRPTPQSLLAGKGVTLTSSMPHSGKFWEAYAYDGDESTVFLSQRPPHKGDTFTLSFHKPLKKSQLTLITGNFFFHDEKNGRAQAALIEAMHPDGTWHPLANLNNGACQTIIPEGCQQLRLTITQDQSHRLVISEWIIKELPQ